jgi:hypothetical protein
MNIPYLGSQIATCNGPVELREFATHMRWKIAAIVDDLNSDAEFFELSERNCQRARRMKFNARSLMELLSIIEINFVFPDIAARADADSVVPFNR